MSLLLFVALFAVLLGWAGKYRARHECAETCSRPVAFTPKNGIEQRLQYARYREADGRSPYCSVQANAWKDDHDGDCRVIGSGIGEDSQGGVSRKLRFSLTDRKHLVTNVDLTASRIRANFRAASTQGVGDG